MRVLLYSEAFEPKIGGPVTVVRLLATYLQEQGTRVVVATPTRASGPDQSTVPVERDCSPARLRRLVQEADVVHLHSFHPGLLARAWRARRKIVCTYHDLTPICPKGTKWKQDSPCLHRASPAACIPCLRAAGLPLTRRLARPPLKAALSLLIDVNVCPGGDGLRRFPLHGLRVIPNGVDTGFFVPGPPRPAEHPPTVLLVARLIPEKGGDLLLDAAAICRQQGYPLRISICGDGPDLPRLRTLANQLGLAEVVRFHGALRDRELLQRMHEADLAVVPSRVDETFGLTAVEAMSCGLPVIGADVGGLGEIVAESGLRFPRGDAAALAAQLGRLLGDPELRRRLGAAGRMLATNRYDWRVMGSSYLSLYRELLGPARP